MKQAAGGGPGCAERRAAAGNLTHQIGFDHRSEDLVGYLLEWAVGDDAGVIDPKVDLVETLDCCTARRFASVSSRTSVGTATTRAPPDSQAAAVSCRAADPRAASTNRVRQRANLSVA
jgi:hypothetical protein